MLALLNAIYAKFTADAALLAAFTGGLHRDQVPEGTAVPYLVSRVVAADLRQSYGGVSLADIHVRFDAFGVGHDAVGTLMQTLIAQLDNNLLTLTAGSNESVTRLSDPIPVLSRHDAQGNDVWHWSVTYEYGVRAETSV